MGRVSSTFVGFLSAVASIVTIFSVIEFMPDAIDALFIAISGQDLNPEYQALSARLQLAVVGFFLGALSVATLAGTFVVFSETFGMLAGTFQTMTDDRSKIASRLYGYFISTTIVVLIGNIAAFLVSWYLIPFTLFLSFFILLMFLENIDRYKKRRS
ncbi:MAG: hypothetical protein AAF225_04275 [Pseudomonadota bacterium]